MDMKKFFTLLTLLTLTLGVSAQQYRKSWDFRKWSAATVANLQAESAKGPSTGAWSDVEKSGATEPTELSKDNCFWEVTHQGNASTPATLTANGEVIAELEGLGYTNTTDRSLAIAVNYGDCTPTNGTGFGPYNGPSYLWLGGKNKNYFVIPHVAPGTVIKMGVESHKVTDARGVQLYVGLGNTGTQLNGPDGNAVATPTTYQDQEWLLPEEVADEPNEDGTYDITIRNTNGCHIYYITVGDGDSPQVEDAKPVAYLYDGSLDEDYAYIYLSGAGEKFSLTEINVAETTATADSLMQYDAIVVSPTIGADNAYLPVVRQAIAYVPMLNLNPYLYEPLGLGKAVEGDSPILGVLDREFAGFAGLELDSEIPTIELLTGGNIVGVELGEYFAADAVLATAGDPEAKLAAMHIHNPGRNAYALLPLPLDVMPLVNHDVISLVVPQTLEALASTKKKVTATGTPVITPKQEDGYTTVTITSANSNAIYYTTDGTAPTAESTRYTEPFTLTTETTVKAFATGDGYTDSDVAEKVVTIAVKAKAPVFALQREQGKTTVTLTTATEGVDVYYNYAGQSTTTASVKYTEPFVVTTPATVTAFANAADGILVSDLAQLFVGVDGIDNSNIKWDVMAHFDANADDWKGKGQQTDDSGAIVNANYFFTWGKNSGSYWDPTSAETGLASDGVTDSTYYTRTLEPETLAPGNGWIIKSIGQVMVWESLNLGYDIGDGSMRNPDAAEDAIGVNKTQTITPNAVTFGKQPTDGPFNATLETTEKYAGPFDVVVYAGNGNEGEIPTMQIETSADGQEWVKLGDVNYSLVKRNWKKTVLSYEGTDEVYVRLHHTQAKSSGQIYDIYLMNNGEESKLYNEQKEAAIATVQPQGRVVSTEMFTIGGMRVSGRQNGMLIIRKTYADGTVKTQKVIK